MNVGEAYVVIRPDTRKFSDEAERDIGGSFKRIGATIASAFVVKEVGSFFAGGVKALANLERLSAQTTAAIKSTGGSANITVAEIEKMAQGIEKLTGIEQENVQEGANLLLTFTGIRNEAGKGNDIFNQATNILTDMSVALGTDVAGSAIQVGKALNDPITGITALTRVGVTFSQEQKSTIKTLVETGNKMEAQKIILAELNKEFGGSAEALGDTLQGRLQKLQNKFGDLQESMAGAVLPAFERLVGVAGTAADAFAALDPNVQAGVVGLGTFAVVLGPVVRLSKDVAGSVVGAAKGVQEFAQSAAAGSKVGSSFASTLGATVRSGLGPLGIGLGVATIATGLFIRSQQKARQETDKFKDSLERQAETGKKEVAQQIASTLANERYQKALKDLGVTNKQVVDAITSGNKARVNELVTIIGVEGGYAKLGGRIQQLGRNFRSAVEETRTENEVLKEVGIETDKTARSTEGLETAQGELGGAFSDTTDEVDKYVDKLREAFDIPQDAREAHIDFLESHHRLVESVKEFGKTFDENTAAGAENIRALGDVIDDVFAEGEAKAARGDFTKGSVEHTQFLVDQLAALKKELPSAGPLLDDHIRRLDALKREADKAAEKLNSIRRELGELKLTDLDGNEWVTRQLKHFADLNYSGEKLAGVLERVRDVTRRINEGKTYIDERGRPHAINPAFRSMGGTVTAGTPYIVGENHRPELFVPNQSGTIYPTAGGPSVTIENVNVTAATGSPHDTADSIVRRLSFDVALAGVNI